MEINDVKQRFGLVGTDPKMDQAIDTALQVAPIQLSVLIIGESGSGKEAFPRVIHTYSKRKHSPYVAVNCGAIPEGTIDSELFGHEKGAFTGAVNERKGYFEEANGGTIFLDEVGELPLPTQSKLLRVLEKGEYMRVGSSLVRYTSVRVVAATNVDLETAVRRGTFREDLFYRLNGVMLRIPPLRERKGDIGLLFNRFTNDFAAQNGIFPVRLTQDALEVLCAYSWPGNVRQLKNVANQVTALAHDRDVDADEIERFMPKVNAVKPEFMGSMLPQVNGTSQQAFNSEREILYKILFDMRKDVQDLKKIVLEMANNGLISKDDAPIIQRLYQRDAEEMMTPTYTFEDEPYEENYNKTQIMPVGGSTIIPMANLEEQRPPVPKYEEQPTPPYYTYIPDQECDRIKKALKECGGQRRKAAQKLGISERTLYRKIRQYDIK